MPREDLNLCFERLAMIAAARGDRARAAEYYRKKADFVHARGEWHDAVIETYLRVKPHQKCAPSGSTNLSGLLSAYE